MQFDEELFEASLCIQSDKWTKDTLAGLPTGKGVLLFCDAAGRPIQLLQAAGLRRTAQAKLVREELVEPTRKTDLSDLTAAVFYTRCENHFELQLTYIRLAHAVFKKNAADWIQLPKVPLAVIETAAPLPYFCLTENPTPGKTRRLFGLFPSRRAAFEFCEILNAVFGLCRNPSLLSTGKEASCPYLQMEICPGPCLNAGLHESYAEAVRRACEAACGHIEQAVEQFHDQMYRAAQAMQFERAGQLKKEIENLTKLAGSDFRRVHDLEQLYILHIDISGKRKIAGKNNKRQLYNAWIITAKTIYDGGRFVPKSPAQVTRFLNHCWNGAIKRNDTTTAKEHLAVLSLFLFRSDSAGLWLDCTEGIPETVYQDLTGGSA
jgi:excinuclease UvrABC nuclease subunit